MKSFFNKKTYLFIGALAILFFLAPEVTLAQESMFRFLDPTYYIGKLFELIVLPLAAGAMAFTGMILDYAVRFSLGTAYIFGNLTVINQSWVIIRDICNLFFIFALIWISISTILNLSGFDTKRKLTQLIIAALVINFSLYFTKVFVDVSNIFGNWLYNGILAALKANAASSMSALIASKLEIYRLWEDPAANAALLAKALNDSGVITQVLKLIVVLVATYVFMYTAILFLTRAVTIIFLLVLSPIGFIGGLLPQIEEYSKKWWAELMDAVTFPIVYLLMLYISLQLINNMEASSVWASFFSGNPAVVAGIDTGKVFKYIIVICALLICLKVAKESAGQLGKAAGGFAGSVSKFSTSIGGVGAAMVGKYTVGAAAARAANNKTLNQLVAGGGVMGSMASSVKGGLNSTADFHFDPRASIKEFGIKGGKGYTSMVKDQQKAQEEAQKALVAKPKEIKPAKVQLDTATLNAYKTHEEYGSAYDQTHREFTENEASIKDYREQRAEKIAKGESTADIDMRMQKAVNARDTASKNRDKIKSAIDKDGEFEVSKKVLAAQEIELKKLKDSGGSKEVIKAMEEAMRQGRAARSAETGPMVKVAETMTKSFADQMKEATGSLGGAARVVAGAAATIATGGIAQISAKQIVGDAKKTSGKLREAMSEGDKKKKQADISKLLLDLSEGDTAPEKTESATPPTPPPESSPKA